MLEKRKRYDQIKVKECKKRDITLIVIPYTVKYNDLENYITSECKKLNLI